MHRLHSLIRDGDDDNDDVDDDIQKLDRKRLLVFKIKVIPFLFVNN